MWRPICGRQLPHDPDSSTRPLDDFNCFCIRSELQRCVTLWSDALAGITLFIVAIPVSIGIASTLGVSPYAGLIAGIIGGTIVGWISGSQTVSVVHRLAWPQSF